MTNWKPGMRCVCVDDGRHMRAWVETGLTQGGIYTIAGLENGPDGIGLLLQEVPMPHRGYYAFHPDRFRPLSEARLDQFRAHLTPMDKQRAEA